MVSYESPDVKKLDLLTEPILEESPETEEEGDNLIGIEDLIGELL